MSLNRFSMNIAVVTSAVLLAACSGGFKSGDGSFSTAEESYCTTVNSFSPSVTITGQAQFRPRNQISTGHLLGETSSFNIVKAEIQILDSNNNIVQCGETSDSESTSVDNISIQVPKVAGTYTIKINSRAHNSTYKVSVLNSPVSNVPYSLTGTFTVSASDTTVNIGTLTADSSSPQVLSGAFNILYQVYLSNKYLRANTTCSGCTTFTVADTVQIFWQPGLSPGAYYGQPSTGISFFSASDSGDLKRGIYILGGLNGDINCTDTDHFDNSVIIHEYGHFLEERYSGSDSPGGSHNGNFIIDPRLAWSEGWANFLQAAVQGGIRYIDSVGNNSCSGGAAVGVNFNLETSQGSDDQMPQSGTPTPILGEGIYRELSVSRVLLDTIQNSGAPDVGAGFAPVWRAFSDSSVGLAQSSVNFRNMGKFNSLLYPLLTSGQQTAFDSLISSTGTGGEYQVRDDSQYARRVTPGGGGGTCTFSITGVNNLSMSGGIYPHLQQGSDYYDFYYDGSFSTITFVATNGTAVADLDYYVFPKRHVLWDRDKAVVYDEASPTSGSTSDTRVLNMSGQPAGWYLIQVGVYTLPPSGTVNIGRSATYYMQTGAGRLCP
ncbi:MAG: hypothetical protein LW875_03120 [Proteobacteria bacterium]|jgi:hypothetical protein|nr:hypothetical protein [Pseudomonadota bacterium]